MLQGWLARMCRFTYGLLTEDGLRNILFRNVCLVYMTSMSKETLTLCVLDIIPFVPEHNRIAHVWEFYHRVICVVEFRFS
jgi:hypothetical protein